jgi:hypothetical protein
MSAYIEPNSIKYYGQLNSVFNSADFQQGSTNLTLSETNSLYLQLSGNETIGGYIEVLGGIKTNSITPEVSGETVTLGSSTSTINIIGTIQNNGSALIATPAGSDQQLQINENGSLGGSSNLTYNYNNNILSIGQSTNSYQSTTALNIYGNVNIANQFQPGQTNNSTTLTIGNGVLSSAFTKGLTITATDSSLTLSSGGYINLDTNSANYGSKIFLNGTPTIGGSNNTTGSCGIYTFNGSVAAGSTSYINLGTSGYIIVSFWTGTLKGSGSGSYNGNWSFAQGIALGNYNGIVLTVSGAKPAISTNNTGIYGQLNLYNNASNSAYYNVWLFADGVTG